MIKVMPIRIEGDVAYVPLTQGYEAIIDASDAHLVEGSNWYAFIKPGQPIYAQRHTARPNRKIVHMHRVIASTPQGMDTDHINGNGLDNRKANLRNSTKAQNQYNSKRPTHNTSGFKGVHFCNRQKKFIARIKVMGKLIHIGSFQTAEDAFSARCAAAERLHGGFAHNGVRTHATQEAR